MNTSKLFEPTKLAGLSLKNHTVMAPMTRSRALGNIPNQLMAEYYAQRAEAGLIVTEGTSPSPNGLGYPRIPGIFSEAQIEGWRLVTQAVHERGGRIFVQLMHTGRIGHPANLPEGARLLAPSAVDPNEKMYTDQSGEQPVPLATPMDAGDIRNALGEFATASTNAIEAGFDGVELHGANGYLIDQFLNPTTNQRTDDYGGTIAKRIRFAIEAAKAASDAIGPQKVGIRLSPYGVFNSMGLFDGIEETYVTLARELSALNLAYIHLVNHSSMGAPEVKASTVDGIRQAFSGALILSGGYGRDRAEADLQSGAADLIAFGKPFLANPDLLERLRTGAPLNQPDFTTLYTPGAQGYTDYPVLALAAGSARQG